MKEPPAKPSPGSTEATAIPYCACGHYARHHDDAPRVRDMFCYLCQCQGIKKRELNETYAQRIRNGVES